MVNYKSGLHHAREISTGDDVSKPEWDRSNNDPRRRSMVTESGEHTHQIRRNDCLAQRAIA